ncbi:MAG: methylated-DNA--[protein]-cysteine S-methyltransferase [Acidobacteriaceae bacterium]|nr:methylated-DNA--[protein]-cysteine S-methyltransferase [Acidobacteriaceae bacterium]
MGEWTEVEAKLTDGLRMRFYAAAREGELWCAAIEDDRHPKGEDEFVWRLGKEETWTRRERGRGSEVLKTAAKQVDEYFAGRRLEFELPLGFKGTQFQVRVWKQLTQIAFGTTKTYGDIAEEIGHPAAFRAVGNANGRNRLPLVAPCHRVVAAGGKLGGFTGGLGLKRRLLDHEAAVLGKRRAA